MRFKIRLQEAGRGAGLFIILALVGCGAASPPCGAANLTPATAFLEGMSRESREFTAVVGKAEENRSAGLHRVPLTRDDGGVEILVLGLGDRPLPLQPGNSYRFRVEYVPGEPAPCGIRVDDRQGLVLLAASDHGVGDRVFLEGVPELSFKLVDAGCPVRSTACLETVQDLALVATAGQASVQLMAGDEAGIDSYQVQCLLAQTVTYSPDCADAGEFSVSYVIIRQP